MQNVANVGRKIDIVYDLQNLREGLLFNLFKVTPNTVNNRFIKDIVEYSIVWKFMNKARLLKLFLVYGS